MAEATMVATLATCECVGPFAFQRGCYAVLAGTNPRAQVLISKAPRAGLPKAIYYGGDSYLKNYVARRKERYGNV